MKISKTLKLTLKNLLLDVKMGEIVAKENTLIFDGEEYEIGTEVFVKDAENEGEVIVAPDGEYTVIEEDKEVKVIVVREGKIEEIRENETEIEDGTTETEVEVEAAEEIIVETPEVEPADETKTEEVSAEDRIKTLEDKMEEMVEGMAKILNAIASIEGRIEAIEEKIAKIEAPAADPAEVQPEVQETKMSKMSYLRKQ